METKVEYLVRTSTPEQIKHYCPGCFKMFGTEVREGARLLIGNHLARRFSGYCGNCGGKLEWSSGDRHMRYITNSAKARAR